MKELTPYEQFLADKLRDLPVPNEDMAWEEMKKLLEEKKDDRPLLPPFFRGCLPWLIAAIVTVTGIAVWRNYYHSSDSTSPASTSNSASGPLKKQKIDSLDQAGFSSRREYAERDSISPIDLTVGNSAGRETSKTQQNALGTDTPSNSMITRNAPGGVVNTASSGIQYSSTSGNADTKKRSSKTGRSKSTKRNASVQGKMKSAILRPTQASGNNNETAELDKSQKPELAENKAEVVERDTKEENEFTEANTDSAKVNSVDGMQLHRPDSLITKPTAADSSVMPADSGEKKKLKQPFTFAAGLAINQYIPIKGEKPVPYDFMGRKGSLGDYIPSLYFRAMKPRWFIQSEFRYGAPNNVKEFVYSKKTTIDTFQTATTSLKTLKKTFYHQVPLTFNYFVTKNWSVGVGIAYNKFTRAVRQEDVRLGIPGTTIDTLISSTLVQDGKDTAFVSNSFQWIAETQYRWRRFSLGLRFAQGLQPYIKYTDPETGLPAEKKNQSLNAFLRFDLWRSKKK